MLFWLALPCHFLNYNLPILVGEKGSFMSMIKSYLLKVAEEDYDGDLEQLLQEEGDENDR